MLILTETVENMWSFLSAGSPKLQGVFSTWLSGQQLRRDTPDCLSFIYITERRNKGLIALFLNRHTCPARLRIYKFHVTEKNKIITN